MHTGIKKTLIEKAERIAKIAMNLQIAISQLNGTAEWEKLEKLTEQGFYSYVREEREDKCSLKYYIYIYNNDENRFEFYLELLRGIFPGLTFEKDYDQYSGKWAVNAIVNLTPRIDLYLEINYECIGETIEEDIPKDRIETKRKIYKCTDQTFMEEQEEGEE